MSEWNLEESRDSFLYTDYYQALNQIDQYQEIKQKLGENARISENDWKFILAQLLFLTNYASSLEEKSKFAVWFASLRYEMGTKIYPKDSPDYWEYYKCLEATNSFKEEWDINKDLQYGFRVVLSSQEESHLNSLLNQHKEASIFRENQSAYFHSYIEAPYGVLYPNEKLYIYAYHHAYQEEKKLVKQLKKNS